MDSRERLNDAEEALRAAIQGLQAGLWTAIPGIAQSFNPTAMTCVVQPSIMGMQRKEDGSNTPIKMPLCLDCPVVFPGAGGFTLTFPIAQGDEGLLIFASRCVDSWWQSGGIQTQAELRLHDLSDGFFLPGVRSQPRVLSGGVSTNSTQLRSDDGNTYIDFRAGKIHLVADEVMVHGRNKTTFDAGGTGFVYQPNQIDTYTDGVPSGHHSPTPPEVPT